MADKKKKRNCKHWFIQKAIGTGQCLFNYFICDKENCDNYEEGSTMADEKTIEEILDESRVTRDGFFAYERDQLIHDISLWAYHKAIEGKPRSKDRSDFYEEGVTLEKTISYNQALKDWGLSLKKVFGVE